jgi:hypothetical protein
MIDAMVPVAEAPVFEVLSSTSVKLYLPDITSVKKPKIKGFRIMWTESKENMSGASTESTDVRETFLVQNLEPSTFFKRSIILIDAIYYFAIALIGETEEGLFSPLVFVPLACKF